jgi:hypothetical protein
MIYAPTYCPLSACDPCKPKPIIKNAYLTATFWVGDPVIGPVGPVLGVVADDPTFQYYNGAVISALVTIYVQGKPATSVSGSSPPQYGFLRPTFYIAFQNVDITIDTTKPAVVTATVGSSIQMDAFDLPRVVLY